MSMQIQTMSYIPFIFLLNGLSCSLAGYLHESINKCSINNGGCSDACYDNGNGSYHCSCPDGFTIGEDGHLCIDVDECFKKVHKCSQQCWNTIGSYTCMCYDGYELLNGTCKDRDECNSPLKPCSHRCLNYHGSYQCKCNSGYILREDKTTCSDINECAVYNGGCSDVCTNTLGSYRCSCYEGYRLLDDQHICGQVNACINASCSNDDKCINTQHGFLCNCTTPHFAGRYCHEVPISTETSHRSSPMILLLSSLYLWIIDQSLASPTYSICPAN